MSIANNIKNLREDCGLTQAEFGKILGVSDKAVSKWEIGAASPRMKTVKKMCDAFGVNITLITEDKSDSTNISVQGILNKYPRLADVVRACEGLSDKEIDFILKQIESLKTLKPFNP